jgi:hypothetical protein
MQMLLGIAAEVEETGRTARAKEISGSRSRSQGRRFLTWKRAAQGRALHSKLGVVSTCRPADAAGTDKEWKSR